MTAASINWWPTEQPADDPFPDDDPFFGNPPPPDQGEALAGAPEGSKPGRRRKHDEDGETKRSAATLLLELAHENYTFGVSTDNQPYALPRHGAPIVRMFRDGRTSLRAALADAYLDTYNRAAPQTALADALTALEGRAGRDEPVPLHLRVARHDDTVLLDLGDRRGRAVQISAAGWAAVDRASVLFRRTALTGALPEPERDGSLEELWKIVNVAEAHRPVLLAYLVAALLPEVPHPVLLLTGEQGSGKSSATRVLSALIDPSPAQLRKAPRDVDGWVTAASGSWVVAIDNLSGLQDWYSDALCRAVTGDGDVRRALYTDGGLTVFAFRRVVLLNGIDIGGVRDDLADRLVTVALERIPNGARRYDADLTADWQAAHPRLLGALLDLTVQVLRALPDVRLDDPPRMADFARVLAAVDEVLGTNGMSTYRSLAGDLAADAVQSDPVLAALVEHVTRSWTGTAADLLSLLESDDNNRARDWPKSARALTGVLRRRAPSLRRLGWEVTDLGRGGKDKALRWHLAPPEEAGNRRATGGTGGHEAGIGDDRCPPDAPGLTSQDPAACPIGGHGGQADPSFSYLDEREEEEDGASLRRSGDDARDARHARQDHDRCLSRGCSEPRAASDGRLLNVFCAGHSGAVAS